MIALRVKVHLFFILNFFIRQIVFEIKIKKRRFCIDQKSMFLKI